jgi:hypothetical protein
MSVLRKTLVTALFVLLVAVSFSGLWMPVARTLVRFHSDWTGIPDWLFTTLWATTTLALSAVLVSVVFLLIRLAVRRFWPATRS